MKKQELGYCGLNCETCLILVAKKNNDNELRIKTAREFFTLYGGSSTGRPIKPEDINCDGCQSEDDLFIGCRSCRIRKCCRERGFDTCANCAEYPVCQVLNDFLAHPAHQQAKDNLDKNYLGQI